MDNAEFTVKDLPSEITLCSILYIYMKAKVDWDFRISDQVKNPDGTDIYPCGEFR